MTTMTAQEQPAARATKGELPLGLIASAGGVLYTLAGLRFTFDHDAYDALSAAMAVLWCLGCLAGLAGIARLGVAGRGTLGKAALALAVAGSGLALLAWLTGFADPLAAEEGTLMIAGRILSILGFLGLGLATFTARRWAGWRRLAPFFYPLAVVLGGLSWAMAEVELKVTLIGLAWIAIGVAIAGTRQERVDDADGG